MTSDIYLFADFEMSLFEREVNTLLNKGRYYDKRRAELLRENSILRETLQTFMTEAEINRTLANADKETGG